MNKAWVVEILSGGVWFPVEFERTRSEARAFAACYRDDHIKTRIRRWVREESK